MAEYVKIKICPLIETAHAEENRRAARSTRSRPIATSKDDIPIDEQDDVGAKDVPQMTEII